MVFHVGLYGFRMVFHTVFVWDDHGVIIELYWDIDGLTHNFRLGYNVGPPLTIANLVLT